MITGVDGVDTVLQTKKTTIIPIRYEHTLYGNYLHSGAAVVKDSVGNDMGTVSYHSDVDAPESAIWKLTTMNSNSVMAKGTLPGLDGNNFDVTYQATLEGSSLDISSIDGADYSVEGDGESVFNQAEKLENRMLVVKYKFKRDKEMWYATDTLKFRNRIRDGVNEWQGFGATVQ